jgi:hypothetical protein
MSESLCSGACRARTSKHAETEKAPAHDTPELSAYRWSKSFRCEITGSRSRASDKTSSRRGWQHRSQAEQQLLAVWMQDCQTHRPAQGSLRTSRSSLTRRAKSPHDIYGRCFTISCAHSSFIPPTCRSPIRNAPSCTVDSGLLKLQSGPMHLNTFASCFINQC